MKAMGGLMKANHQGHGSSSNIIKGKSYGLMLLIAIGAAVFGVMVLHKFRERRVFNLLLTEKDRELTNLQLLLQKERDHARQARLNLEEMRTKVTTLRSQKRGLDSKIREMHYRISSLREEQRVIELALEEKQNEIKIIRGREAEMVKQKESEAEELKNRLEAPIMKVWSVSTDDPSNATTDLQTKTSLTELERANADNGKKVGAKSNESLDHEFADNSAEQAESDRSRTVTGENQEQRTTEEDGKENRETSIESRGKIREQANKADNSGESISVTRTRARERTDGDVGENIDNESQRGEALIMQENNNPAKTEAVGNHHAEIQTAFDDTNEEEKTQSKVLQTSGDRLVRKIVDAHGAENQESVITHNGGMKLKMPDHPQFWQHRLERDRYLKRKNKRKRMNRIHRSKVTNETAVMKDKSFIQGTVENQREGSNEDMTVRGESSSVYHDKKTSDDLQTGENGELPEDLEWRKAGKNAEESKDRPQATELLNQEKHRLAEEDISITSEAKDQEQSDPEEGEKQSTDLLQPEDRTDTHKNEVSERTETGNNDKELDNHELENFKESESESDASNESRSHFEADGELNSARSNESEFE